MNRIFLIENKIDLDLFAEHGEEDDKVVLLNYDLEGDIRERAIDYSTINDYVDMDELLDLFLKVFHDLKDWYDEPHISTFLSSENAISENVGLVLNKLVSDAYFMIINYAYLIDRIIEKEKARGFVCGHIKGSDELITLSDVLETLYARHLEVKVLCFSSCDTARVPRTSRKRNSFKSKLMEYASKCSFAWRDVYERSVLLVGDFEKLRALIPPLKGKANPYVLSDAINLEQYIYLLRKGGRYLSRKTAGYIKGENCTEQFNVEGFLRCFNKNADISVNGMNVASMISKYIGGKVRCFDEDILSEYTRCKSILSLFKENDKVILDEEVSINSRLLTSLANSKGLSSEVVAHGYINHSMGILPSICSKMHVWNKWQKLAIGEFGGKISEVCVSGCLKYAQKTQKRSFSSPNNANKKFVILFAPTALNKRRAFNIWYYMRYFELFFDEIRVLSEEMPIEVRIKYHPGDSNSARIRKLVDERGLSDIAIETPDRSNALSAITKVDLLVSMYSTIIVDALYLNKPVVNLGPPRYKIFEDLECFREGIVTTIERRGDLCKKISSVKSGKIEAMSESEYKLFCEKFINISPVHPAQSILGQDFPFYRGMC